MVRDYNAIVIVNGTADVYWICGGNYKNMDRRDGYIMNEIMLRAENIERTYHAGSVDVPALKNCTLEFGQGEFTAIIGKEWFR